MGKTRKSLKRGLKKPKKILVPPRAGTNAPRSSTARDIPLRYRCVWFSILTQQPQIFYSTFWICYLAYLRSAKTYTHNELLQGGIA